jgi:hypothetical protein
VAEGGANDSFTISLSRKPSAAVTVTLTVGGDLLLARGNAPGAAFGKTFTLVIQPSDWDLPHVVTVAAVDDTAYEGPETPRVSIAVTSADASFGGKTSGFDVAVTGNDGPHGVAIAQTGGTTSVTEGGGGDLFTIALAVRPTANVTLIITCSSDLLVFASGSSPAASHTIVFTPADWATPRALLVEAINDLLEEGTEVAALTFRFTSADPAYNNLAVSPLPVIVLDNDGAPPASPPSMPPSPPPAPPPAGILTPGKLVESGVMSGKGIAILNRPSSEVASITGTADGLLVIWHDDTSLLLKGMHNIAFLDGQVSFAGDTPTARAYRAYETFLGVAPPPDLLVTLADMLAAGAPMSGITAWLLQSPVWAARTAGLSTRQQMELIYTGATGASDKASVDWLMGALASPTPFHVLTALLLDIPAAVAHSAQHPTGFWIADPFEREVVRAFDAALDMLPDPFTVASWSNVLRSGAMSVQGLYGWLADTEIFKARHASQTSTEFVISLYEQAYERPPTDAELQWCINALDTGATTRLVLLYALGVSQGGTSDAPGTVGASPIDAYAAHQAVGETLGAGESLANIAVGGNGRAVTVRAATDLARIDLATDGLALRWQDGEVIRLDPVSNLSFADGDLVLDPMSRDAIFARLYEVTMGEALPGWGSAAFAGIMDRGATLQSLTAALLTMPEAHARLDHLDEAAQVTLFHRSLLGSDPSTEMVDYLRLALHLGISVPALLVWMAELPDSGTAFQASHPTGVWVPNTVAAAVIRAYDTVLDTIPDAGSLMIWQPVVAQGDLRALYQNLMTTPAHVAQYEGATTAEWVLGHYRAAMEADPTSSELAHWTALLNAGVSSIDVAMAIGELQPLPDPPRYATASIDLL